MSKHLAECGYKKYTIISFYKITGNKSEGETKEKHVIEKFKVALK